MTKFESLREDFTNALLRLEEALQEKKTDIVRDSAIKRFEMAFELAWKTIKAFLEERHNATCLSPKACFRDAYRQELIEYDEAWMNIADDRNLTAHTYYEPLAEKIYSELPAALALFKTLAASLKEKGDMPS